MSTRVNQKIMEINLSDSRYSDYEIAGKYLYKLDNNELQTLNGSQTQVLGTNEANLLRLFIQNPGQVLSRSLIQKRVWQDNGFQVDDSSLTQAVFSLRKLLGDSSKSPAYILTVPRQGYKFIASVVQAQNSTDTAAPVSQAPEESRVQQEREHNEENSRYRFKGLNLNIFLFVAVCLLVPAFVYLVLVPEKPSYTVIQTINGIDVKAILGVQPKDEWLGSIENCVSFYTQEAIKPTEVIISGGKLQKLSLNFVYSPERSALNKTVELRSEDASYHFCQATGENDE